MRSRCSVIRLDGWLAPLLVALAGCASNVVTSVHPDSDKIMNTGPTTDGVSYFLPTNSVRVVFTNVTIASEVKKAKDALKKATKSVKTATKKLADAKKKLAAGDAKKKQEYAALQKAVTDEKKRLDDAEAQEKTATATVKKAEEKVPQILVEVLPPVADTSQVYVAKLDHEIFYHDTLTLKTSAAGLLTKVIYRAEDETGDVVHDLVEAAIEAAKLYARLEGLPLGPSAKPSDAERAAPKPCQAKVIEGDVPYTWEFTIDPSKPEEIAEVNVQLAEVPLPFLLSIRAPDKKFTLPKEDFDGIYYRRPLPYTINIHQDEESKLDLCDKLRAVPKEQKVDTAREFMDKNLRQIPTTQSKQVVMAAGGPVTPLLLDARSLVVTNIDLTLKDGMLLNSVETRPSEALGFSTILLDVVTTVGDAVGEIMDNIVPVEIKWTQQDTGLVTAETELMRARQENAALQKELLEQFESTSQPVGP